MTGETMFPERIYKVSFGMLFQENSGGDYSYLDYDVAMKTFLTYQQLGWDYVSFEPILIAYDDHGRPYIAGDSKE